MSTETKNTKTFYNTEIPSDWDVIEFGEFAEVSKGKYNPIENGNMKCLELEHLEQGTGAINGWTNSVEQKSIKNKFKNGQVLFGKLRPYLQKYWLAEFDGVCSSEIWVLNSISKKCTNEFLFRIVQTNKFIQVANVSSGSKMPRADWEYVASFPFLLPPLPEQKAIAQVLSKADAGIHTTEKLIAQKELRKKWLMQQLLTGKKRLEGFEGEWKELSYEKILKIVKRNFDWDENEIYKLISVRRRSGGIFYREALYGHQILVKTLRTANEGDFLFSKMQILHGASALVTREFDGAKISGSYIAVVPKEKKQLNMKFFQWYSQTPYFYHQTYISSYGVHIEKMTFDFDTFLQLEMKLPSIEEQSAIALVLQAADKEISLLKTKAEKLRELKKGLMQVLLTGKVRLKIKE
ncbi:MAG: restriction endonuclease subunit S [Lentimicrobium sp.]|nr:restriction endonuclease subunit S [Lentimicrobium sp.]